MKLDVAVVDTITATVTTAITTTISRGWRIFSVCNCHHNRIFKCETSRSFQEDVVVFRHDLYRYGYDCSYGYDNDYDNDFVSKADIYLSK